MQTQNRHRSRLAPRARTAIGLASVVSALLALPIVGCGSGSAGPAGPAGEAGTNGTPGTAGTNGTNGTNGTSVVGADGGPEAVSSAPEPAGTNCQFGGVKLTIGTTVTYICDPSPTGTYYATTGLTFNILSVTQGASADAGAAGAISVRFTAKDDNGLPVDLAGKYSVNQNISPSFALAYYTVDANGNVTPLNVYTQTSHTLAADGGAPPATPGMYTPLPAIGATTGATPGSGTIVENGSGAGDYTYTFPTVATPATASFGYVGGVTLNPAALTAPHVVWIRGQRQTDLTNATDGPTLYTSNVPYYFYPSGGDGGAPAPRQIVNAANCWNCHDKFRLETTTTADGITATDFVQHSGGMIDGTLCNVCHNPQRDAVEYGGVGTSASEVHVHRIHDSVHLQPANIFDKTTATYPQDLRNCNVCHGNALQGAQHQTNPSVAACQSCHDYVDFTGTLTNGCTDPVTLGTNGLPVPCKHVGGKQALDAGAATCMNASCHGVGGGGDLTVVHSPVEPPDPTGAEMEGGVASNSHTNAGYEPQGDFVPAGAASFQYVIKSVGVWTDSSVTPSVLRPEITFQLQMSSGDAGFTPVVFNTAGTSAAPNELITGFVGSPDVYWFWSVPQDGITPTDWNASTDVSIRSALNGIGTTTATMTEANGFYTIQMTNVAVPATAAYLTGGVGYGYGTAVTSLPLTQTNLPAYPYNATTHVGGLVMTTTDVTMVASGCPATAGAQLCTARRTIIANSKCQACHGKLGIDPQAPPGDGLVAGQPGFHSGQRNDGASCAGCHTNNLADENNTGWAIGSKYFIHAIHGDRKRSQPYYWNAAYNGTTPTAGYYSIEYRRR